METIEIICDPSLELDLNGTNFGIIEVKKVTLQANYDGGRVTAVEMIYAGIDLANITKMRRGESIQCGLMVLTKTLIGWRFSDDNRLTIKNGKLELQAPKVTRLDHM
jgi:hypothetical protein